MIVEHIKSTTVITQEKLSLAEFVTRLNKQYKEYASNNIIINLFSLTSLKGSDLKEFALLSDQHKQKGNSFVIVTDSVPYDEIPENITAAPTLQEAHDVIEMEEIERDLGI